ASWALVASILTAFAALWYEAAQTASARHRGACVMAGIAQQRPHSSRSFSGSALERSWSASRQVAPIRVGRRTTGTFSVAVFIAFAIFPQSISSHPTSTAAETFGKR